jgi:hypothetical protein
LFCSPSFRQYQIVKPQFRVALPTPFSFIALLVALALSTLGADSNPANVPGDASTLPPPSNGAISPQDQADALHFVIAADREVLCRLYLAHRAADGGSRGGPGNEWPCPSVELRGACESIQSLGAEFSYALRSLAPVGPRNGPQTELEKAGLAFIASHPGDSYTDKETLGGRRYFTAVYPDLPASESCIDCHNRISGPSSRPHKAGDVLGGLVMRVPLEF